jgi:ubiquinone/menaquinone biosynthesis C-methylase UbiE
MTFAVPAEAYDRLMGRYSYALCDALAKVAGVEAGARVLDVGAGTGKGTLRLAELVGAECVAVAEPSEPFAQALRERLPGSDVRHAAAESLPFEDDTFDAAVAHLVVNFMADPERGVGEMRRVTRLGGIVAACVWDYAERMTLLARFWDTAAALDPEELSDRDERSGMRFAREGELAELWRSVGLEDVESGELVVSAGYESFDDLWEPFTLGVAPAGSYASSLDPERQAALRDEFRRRLDAPDGPFRLEALAWYATGRA